MSFTCRTSARRAIEEEKERVAALADLLEDIRNAEPEPEPAPYAEMTEAEADAVLERCDAQMQRAHDAGLFRYLMALWDTLPPERQAEINAMLV